MTKNQKNETEELEIFNIGKKYKKRTVLKNVSLHVKKGEAVGLLGPNGAGKTTCFYCVTGLITPDYGDVYVGGKDITDMPMYKRARMGIGYLPQEASIFRNMSVCNYKAVSADNYSGAQSLLAVADINRNADNRWIDFFNNIFQRALFSLQRQSEA